MAGRVKAAAAATHSKNYDKVRRYYGRGLWTKAMVHRAVACKWITGDEYKEIVGEEYAEEA